MTQAAYHPALTAAIETNKDIIMEALKKQGSWSRWYLKHQCEEKGFADDLSFTSAMDELVKEGKIVVTTEDGEPHVTLQ